MNEALKTVVRAYQAEVQRGWALFRQYKGSDDTDLAQGWFHMRTRVASFGYLDAERRHAYFFHGIGLRVQLALYDTVSSSSVTLTRSPRSPTLGAARRKT